MHGEGDLCFSELTSYHWFQTLEFPMALWEPWARRYLKCAFWGFFPQKWIRKNGENCHVQYCQSSWSSKISPYPQGGKSILSKYSRLLDWSVCSLFEKKISIGSLTLLPTDSLDVRRTMPETALQNRSTWGCFSSPLVHKMYQFFSFHSLLSLQSWLLSAGFFHSVLEEFLSSYRNVTVLQLLSTRQESENHSLDNFGFKPWSVFGFISKLLPLL